MIIISLFRFNPSECTPECRCDECNYHRTLESVLIFADLALYAEDKEELVTILFDLFKTAKDEGVKDYIYEEIERQQEKLNSMSGLDNNPFKGW